MTSIEIAAIQAAATAELEAAFAAVDRPALIAARAARDFAEYRRLNARLQAAQAAESAAFALVSDARQARIDAGVRAMNREHAATIADRGITDIHY